MYSVVCFGHCPLNRSNQNENRTPGEKQKEKGVPQKAYNGQHCTQKTPVIIPLTRPQLFMGTETSIPTCWLYFVHTHRNICCTKDVLHTPLLLSLSLSLCVCVIHSRCIFICWKEVFSAFSIVHTHYFGVYTHTHISENKCISNHQRTTLPSF